MISISLFDPGIKKDNKFTYVVLGARYKDQWIFVRHRDRQTWEMPAGHIEAGESADEAASRELSEETGAVSFEIKSVCDYSVTVNNKMEFGRLYFAEIEELEPTLEYEIEELVFAEGLPSLLTYPEVQTLLFERLEAFISEGNALLLRS